MCTKAKEYIFSVAALMYVSDAPRPEIKKTGKGFSGLLDYIRLCDKWANAAELVAIALPERGNVFCFNTPEEAADKLEYLRGLGYRIPQYAIDELRKEKENK